MVDDHQDAMPGVSCRYLCWWCSACALYGAAVRIDQAITQLRIFLKTGPLSKRGVLSTVRVLAHREPDLPFHPSLTPPDLLLCDATELPPAGKFPFPMERSGPHLQLHKVCLKRMFDLASRSDHLFVRGGKLQHVLRVGMQLPLALPPLPFVGLQQHVYEEVMSTRGDRRKSHVVAFDARQDMRCVVIPESMLLSLKTSKKPKSSCWWFDLITAIWKISSDACLSLCRSIFVTFEQSKDLKVLGKSVKNSTGTNSLRIRLRSAKYVCARGGRRVQFSISVCLNRHI